MGFLYFTALELKCKKKNYCLCRWRTNYIRLKNLIIKKLPEQNFQALSFISKRSAVVVLLIFLLQQYLSVLIVAIGSNIITVAMYATIDEKI